MGVSYYFGKLIIAVHRSTHYLAYPIIIFVTNDHNLPLLFQEKENKWEVQCPAHELSKPLIFNHFLF